MIIGTGTKWHPGHFYAILEWMKNDISGLNTLYSELEATPAFRGVVIRFSWNELETSKGSYNFNIIDRRLEELSMMGRRLIIIIELKEYAVDDYPMYPGAVSNWNSKTSFPFGAFGSQVQLGNALKLQNPRVRDRLIDFVRKLGNRYNTNEYFEAIGFTETSFSAIPSIEGTQEETDYYNNLLLVNTGIKTAFPNTVRFQLTNYPRPLLETFIPALTADGVAVAVPDVFPEENGLTDLFPGGSDGVYTYLTAGLAAQVPIMSIVAPKNYINMRLDGSGTVPTVQQLLDYAKTNLNSHYIMWTRDPAYFASVLTLMGEAGQTADASGGLLSTLPSAYTSAIV